MKADFAPPSFQDWQKRGSFVEVLGHRLFVIDEGKGEEVIAILHGYPSCSYDYYRILPILSSHYRIVIHDHLGFGLSAKPTNYSYSLIEQADIAIGLWEALGLSEVHLLAHDYGTSVATELIARYNRGSEPIRLKKIILGNGSMHIELAKLQWTQKLLRTKLWGPILANLSTKGLFNRSMKKLWFDKTTLHQAELDVLWAMLRHNSGIKTFPMVSRYLWDRQTFWHRWIGGLQQTDKHIDLIWADKDPVAIIDMAHLLHQEIPHNTLQLLPNVGHYPMLEAPVAYAKMVLQAVQAK
ncbi:MAG: alpha/beta hydrolase [Bacteroidota bacterium]